MVGISPKQNGRSIERPFLFFSSQTIQTTERRIK